MWAIKTFKKQFALAVFFAMTLLISGCAGLQKDPWANEKVDTRSEMARVLVNWMNTRTVLDAHIASEARVYQNLTAAGLNQEMQKKFDAYSQFSAKNFLISALNKTKQNFGDQFYCSLIQPSHDADELIMSFECETDGLIYIDFYLAVENDRFVIHDFQTIELFTPWSQRITQVLNWAQKEPSAEQTLVSLYHKLSTGQDVNREWLLLPEFVREDQQTILHVYMYAEDGNLKNQLETQIIQECTLDECGFYLIDYYFEKEDFEKTLTLTQPIKKRYPKSISIKQFQSLLLVKLERWDELKAMALDMIMHHPERAAGFNQMFEYAVYTDNRALALKSARTCFHSFKLTRAQIEENLEANFKQDNEFWQEVKLLEPKP